MLTRLAAVALLTVASGCGGAPLVDGPTSTLEAYSRALATGDVQAARALEVARDRDARRDDDRAQPELARLASRIERAPTSALTEHAHLALRDRAPVALVREDGAFRLDDGLPLVPSMAEPEHAVAALHEGLARHDFGALEELMARRTRAAWEAELTRLAAQTRDLDALAIERTGEHATVRTPDGTRIVLLQEAGQWRVVEVLPPESSPP